MVGRSAVEAVAMIRAGITALLDADLTTLSATELTALVADVETERRRSDSIDQTLIAELIERGIAGEYARTSPVDLLVQLLRISPRDAKTRVSRARDLGPRRTVTGEPLDPIFTEVAAAQRTGQISGEHASVITRAIDAIPDRYAAEFDHIVEHALTEQARHTHPGAVATAAQILLTRIDQDGQAPREEETQRRREFGIRMRPDGTGTPYGTFTPARCATWNPIIDALSAPTPAADDHDGNGPGERDFRTAGQRRHDGLLDAGLRLLRSGSLPDSGGMPVTILAHLEADHLLTNSPPEQPTGRPDWKLTGPDDRREGLDIDQPSNRRGIARVAVTGHGTLLPVVDLFQLASEAQVVTAVTSPTGGILSYGQTAAWPPAPNASPSPPEITAVRSPAVRDRRPSARPTTSSRGSTTDRPVSTTRQVVNTSPRPPV